MPWRPANGHHAIERATVSILFSDGLTSHAHGLATRLLTETVVPLGLNEILVLPPPVQMNIVQRGQTPSPVSQVIGPPQGRSMRRSEHHRLMEEVILTADMLTYSTYTYDRWAEFKDRTNHLLPPVFERVCATTAISEVRLEYWDRFDRNQSEDTALAPLTNPNSILIGNSLRTNEGAWHSHIGFFTKFSERSRTLVNANIDAIISTPNNVQQFSGGINGQARIYSMASVQNTIDENWLGDWDNAIAQLGEVHDLLKSILHDVVHPDISAAIQLNAKPLVIS